MNTTFKPLGDFLRVLIAPAIWFAHLSIVYGAEALICIGPPSDRTTRMGWIVFLATSAALTGIVILVVGLLRPWQAASSTFDRERSWLVRTSLLLALLSAAGIVWTTLPATILPACTSLFGLGSPGLPNGLVVEAAGMALTPALRLTGLLCRQNRTVTRAFDKDWEL